MSLRYGVLGLLQDQPMTGYSIYHYFAQVLSPMWFAQQSQVYRELGLLEKEGFVTSEIELQTSKPNKRIYSITDRGTEALTLWVGEFDFLESMRHRDSFALRIFFAGTLAPMLDPLIGQLNSYIDENQAMLVDLKSQQDELEGGMEEAIKSGNPKEGDRLFYFNLSLMRGKAQYEMNIAWAQEALLLCQAHKKKS